MYDDLQKGTIHAVATDQVLLEHFRKTHNDFKISVLAGKSDYGIGVRKDDKEFLKLLNEILQKMKDDGTLKRLKEKIN